MKTFFRQIEKIIIQSCSYFIHNYNEYLNIKKLSRIIEILLNFLLYLFIINDDKINQEYFLKNFFSNFFNIMFMDDIENVPNKTIETVFSFIGFWFFFILYIKIKYKKNNFNEKFILNVILNISPFVLLILLFNFPNFFIIKNGESIYLKNIKIYSFYHILNILLHLINILIYLIINLFNMYWNNNILWIKKNKFSIKYWTIYIRYLIIFVFWLLLFIKLNLNIILSNYWKIIMVSCILFIELIHFLLLFFWNPFYNKNLNKIENYSNLIIMNLLAIILKNLIIKEKYFFERNNLLLMIIVISFEIKLLKNLDNKFIMKELNIINLNFINLKQLKTIYSYINNNDYIDLIKKIIYSHKFACNNINCYCNLEENNNIEIIDDNKFTKIYYLILIKKLLNIIKKIKNKKYLFYFLNLFLIKIYCPKLLLKYLNIVNKKYKNNLIFKIYKKYIKNKVQRNYYEINKEKFCKYSNFYYIFKKCEKLKKLYIKQIDIKNDIFILFDENNISLYNILLKLEKFEINDYKINYLYKYIDKKSYLKLNIFNKTLFYLYNKYLRFFDYKANQILLDISNNLKIKDTKFNLNIDFNKISFLFITKNEENENLYKIKNTTNNIINLLKIKSKEIIGKNLEEFLPKIIKDIHFKYMDDFYFLKKFKSYDNESKIYFMNNNKGKLIQINLYINYNINKKNGNIEFICFIEKNENKKRKKYYLQLDNNYEIINYNLKENNDYFKLGNTINKYNNDLKEYLNSSNKIKKEYFKYNINKKDYDYNYLFENLIEYYQFSNYLTLPIKFENNKMDLSNIKLIEYYFINDKISCKFLEIIEFKMNENNLSDYNSFLKLITNNKIINSVIKNINKLKLENFEDYNEFNLTEENRILLTNDFSNNLNLKTLILDDYNWKKNEDNFNSNSDKVSYKKINTDIDKEKNEFLLTENNNVLITDNNNTNSKVIKEDFNKKNNINKNNSLKFIEQNFKTKNKIKSDDNLKIINNFDKSSYSKEINKVIDDIYTFKNFKIIKHVKKIIIIYIIVNLSMTISALVLKLLYINDLDNSNKIYDKYSSYNLEYLRISYLLNLNNLIKNNYINPNVYNIVLNINFESTINKEIIDFKLKSYLEIKQLNNLLFEDIFKFKQINEKLLNYKNISNNNKLLIEKSNKSSTKINIISQFNYIKYSLKNNKIYFIKNDQLIKNLLHNLNSDLFINNNEILNEIKMYTIYLNNLDFFIRLSYLIFRMFILFLFILFIILFIKNSYNKRINFWDEIFKFKKNFEIKDLLKYINRLKKLFENCYNEEKINNKISKFKKKNKFKEISNPKYNIFIDNDNYYKRYINNFLKLVLIIIIFIFFMIIINLFDSASIKSNFFNLNYLRKFNNDFEIILYKNINNMLLNINYSNNFNLNNKNIIKIIEEDKIKLQEIIFYFEEIKNNYYGTNDLLIKNHINKNKICDLFLKNLNNICMNKSFTLLSKDLNLFFLEFDSFLNNLFDIIKSNEKSKIVEFLNNSNNILTIYYFKKFLNKYNTLFSNTLNEKEMELISDKLKIIIWILIIYLVFFYLIMVYFYKKKISNLIFFFEVLNRSITFLPSKILQANHNYIYYIKKITIKFRNKN